VGAPEPDSIKLLWQIGQGQGDAGTNETAHAALLALGSMGRKLSGSNAESYATLAADLGQMATRHPDPNRRAVALKALANTGDKWNAAVAAEALTDTAPVVRAAAVATLALLDDAPTLDLLTERIHADPDGRVRAAIGNGMRGMTTTSPATFAACARLLARRVGALPRRPPRGLSRRPAGPRSAAAAGDPTRRGPLRRRASPPDPEAVTPMRCACRSPRLPAAPNLTETAMAAQTIACFAGLAFLLTACATTTAVAADDLTQSIVLQWGARDASTEESSGDDEAGVVIGADYSSRCWDWLGWEAGFSYSEGFTLFGDEPLHVYEAGVGARATYAGFADAGAGLLPYGAVGVSALAMEGRDADSSAAGAYVRGGLCYVFRAGFTLGCDLKFLASSSDDVESYGQFTFQLGWSF
jgi:hypothetical protein